MASKLPEDMTDEELAAIVAGTEPEVIPDKVEEPEVTPSEPAKEEPEPEAEVVEEPEPAEEPAEEPEERPISRREQLRVQQLLEKYGNPAPAAAPEIPKAMDYTRELEADPAVAKLLEDDRKAYGRELYEQGLRQTQTAQWETLLSIDAPAIEAKYPQLDKTSKDFYPALANALNTKYLNDVGFNPGNPSKGIPSSVQKPGIRYSDFIESEMEYAQELASIMVKETKQNIVKQAAQTAIRPGGAKPKSLDLNKAPEDMTDEELAEAVKVHPVRKF